MRAATLVLLVVLVSGCLGARAPACPGCAAPTDTEPSFPTHNDSASAPPPDFSDAGYVMDAPWHVGDGWDYLSNDSLLHTIRVLREAPGPNGTRLLLIEETDRSDGSPTPRSREDSWIDGDSLTRYNSTYLGGSLSYSFTPSDPQWRFPKNGTFSYNETATTPTTTTITSVRANSFFSGFEKVTLPGQNVNAARIEHRILRAVQGGDTVRVLDVHDAFREYGGDVRYQFGGSDSVYTLQAVKFGDLTRGALISIG